MAVRQFLSEFEELIMLTIIKLENYTYGVPILETLEEITNKRISTSALYVTLQKLEEKGLIFSSMGEVTLERGGRAKKYFTVESFGRQVLLDTIKAREAFKKGLYSDYTS